MTNKLKAAVAVVVVAAAVAGGLAYRRSKANHLQANSLPPEIAKAFEVQLADREKRGFIDRFEIVRIVEDAELIKKIEVEVTHGDDAAEKRLMTVKLLQGAWLLTEDAALAVAGQAAPPEPPPDFVITSVELHKPSDDMRTGDAQAAFKASDPFVIRMNVDRPVSSPCTVSLQFAPAGADADAGTATAPTQSIRITPGSAPLQVLSIGRGDFEATLEPGTYDVIVKVGASEARTKLTVTAP